MCFDQDKGPSPEDSEDVRFGHYCYVQQSAGAKPPAMDIRAFRKLSVEAQLSAGKEARQDGSRPHPGAQVSATIKGVSTVDMSPLDELYFNRATGGSEYPPPGARAFASFVCLPNAENIPPSNNSVEEVSSNVSLPSTSQLYAGIVFTTETEVTHGHPHSAWRLCSRNHPHCYCQDCYATNVLTTQYALEDGQHPRQ
jgi:hypothetical protein